MDIQSSSVTPYQKLLSMLGQQQASSAPETAASEAASATSSSNNPNADTAELHTVQLSAKAVRLQKISEEFFSGTIQSNQIPALTQRLYEEGFLSTSEYQSLGGQAQKTSAVQDAVSFLNHYASTALDQGQSEQANASAQAANALANMNKLASAASRQVEQQAQAWVSTTLQALKQQEDADPATTEGFAKVLEVFEALAKVRSGHGDTAIASYNQVQEAVNEQS